MGATVTYGDYTFPQPTPKVTWDYQYNATSAGRNIGATLNIGLEGSFYNAGSADSYDSSAFAQNVINLESAFRKDFQSFRIDGCLGSEVFPQNDFLKTDIDDGIRVESFEISNSQDEYWRNLISYSIQMSVPLNSGQKYLGSTNPNMLNGIYISSLSDTMSVSEEDGADYLQNTNTALYPSGGPLSTRFLTISRTISAEGKDRKDKRAITSAIEAVKKVNEHLSFESRIKKDFADLKFFDKSTSQNYNEVAGSYSVTDTYKAFSGNPSKYYTHEYNISNNIDSKLNRTVSINGTIQGYNLETTASTDIIFNNGVIGESEDKEPCGKTSSNAYAMASGGFTAEIQLIKDRVVNSAYYPSGSKTHGYIKDLDIQQTYDGFKIDQEDVTNTPKIKRLKYLHPVPLSFDTSHDINAGSVSYSCSFDNRILNLIPGAVTESLNVNDNYSVTGYNSVNVMYKGAIMQTIGTTTIPSRSVTYSATFDTLVPDNTDGEDVMTQGVILGIGAYDTKKLHNIFLQFDPSGLIPGYTNSWITEDNVNANFIDGTFSKTRSWNYSH
jgi:hypothetical protein